MSPISEKQKITELRKRLSIELCSNFVKRLNPAQSPEVKVSAIIAIRNFIKESKIEDPFLFSYLVDTIIDPDKKVRNWVIKVIKEIAEDPRVCREIIELLEIKLQEVASKVKKEISGLLKALN